MPWHTACTTHDLAEGRCHHVEIGGENILLTLIDGTVHAVSNICSHDYAELSDGELDGTEIVCPLHLARFDVRTGEVTAPPAYEALEVFAVEVEDGNVRVEIPD